MKINEIIELSSAFSAEVNVDRDFEYKLGDNNRFVDGYLPNASSRLIIREIFDTLSSRDTRKLHLITASYGTGKSYLLLMLAYLLGRAEKSALQEFNKKIEDKDDYYNDGLKDLLKAHWSVDSQFLVVIPRYGTEDFDQALLAALNEALATNEISYQPKTYYIRAAETLESWREENRELFQQFEKRISGKSGSDLIRLLKNCDGASYLFFKEAYKDIVHSDFSETHGDVYEAFSDTAKKILDFNYKGIVILHDEFGGVLDKLINKSSQSSSLKIQDFLERLKDRKVANANVIFIAASHQDPTTIQENKQQNIEKIIGRFERHRLEIADSESEELMGKVFISKNIDRKSELLPNRDVDEQFEFIEMYDLYEGKSEDWIKNKIVRDLYPLHPLTSFILPRLSNQFAQNTRSMFNFLSPNEVRAGSLNNYISHTEDKDASSNSISLFTPDMLLGFFEKNLSDAKSEIISGIVDSYQTTIGRFKDNIIIRLMQNILVLTATRKEQVRPRFEILEWAMHNLNTADLKTLLDDLVHKEILEFNDNEKVYEFPAFNSKSLSKIIKEIEGKTDFPTLQKCKNLWNEIFIPEPHFFDEHNDKFGSNRSFKFLAVSDVDEFESHLETLRKYYLWELKDPQIQGYVFHLIVDDENDLDSFRKKMLSFSNLNKYLVFAWPNVPSVFQKIRDKTFNFIVLQQASQHPEVTGNANHSQRIKADVNRLRTELTSQIKDLYQPGNWFWGFSNIDEGVEVKSVRAIERKMDELVDLLFTVVPKIKDNALWFSKLRPGDSLVVTEGIITPEKERIQLFNRNNQSVSSRIIERFFEHSGLTKNAKNLNKIQYGEIKVPETGSVAEAIFKVFEKSLKVGQLTNPETFVKPLINAPYGLSEQLVKMMFTCYIRANQESLHIVDSKKPSIFYDKDPTNIENIFKKSGNYAIRRMDMSVFEIKYIKQLNGLFVSQIVSNSFGDLSKRFDGLVRFFTNLSWALIKRDEKVTKFYEILIPFLESVNDNSVDREKESRIFFMEILPNTIIGCSSKEQFEDDDDNIALIVEKLRFFKEFPASAELEYKREVILNLAKKVFRQDVTTPDDFKLTVKAWFENLSTATKRLSAFEDEKISYWLKSLRSDENVETFKFYLEELPLLSIKDWKDLALEQYSFIDQIGGYKKEVESYKGSPLVPYQAIARACFAMSASECASEEIFNETFKKWWQNLPVLTKEAKFEDSLLNIFVEEMKSSFSTKDKFLVNVPIKWKDNGFDILFNNEWENWSPTETREVAERYGICVLTLNQWRPPIAEELLFGTVGGLFEGPTDGSVEELQSFILNDWYERLPMNTKNADWQKEPSERHFLDSIRTPNFLREFLINSFPKYLVLKEFRYWNEEILEEYINAIKIVKDKVESYRRSLFELILHLERKQVVKSQSTNEFRIRLKSELLELEIFRTGADMEEGMVPDTRVISFMKQVRKLNSEGDFWSLVEIMAIEFSIENEYYFWSVEDQNIFVKEFNSIIKYLQNWKYPEDKQLQNAKERISSELSIVQSDLHLSKSQLLKVLRDFIREHMEEKK